jgi:hypothetical protein
MSSSLMPAGQMLVTNPRAHIVIKNIGLSDPPSPPKAGTIYHKQDEGMFVIDEKGEHVPIGDVNRLSVEPMISRLPGETDDELRRRIGIFVGEKPLIKKNLLPLIKDLVPEVAVPLVKMIKNNQIWSVPEVEDVIREYIGVANIEVVTNRAELSVHLSLTEQNWNEIIMRAEFPDFQEQLEKA